MSSITSKFTTYRIALFQSGLADDSTGFNETVKLLVKNTSKVIDSGEQIDMSHFNPSNRSFYKTDSTGYYTKSTIAHNDFDKQISKIVELAKANVGKTILVRTFLNHGFNSNHNLDSIDNQTTKLCCIIDALKKYNNVEIILVGHSQGGLVNLESAIARNTSVSRLISISTPYAPVKLADTLLFVDYCTVAFKFGSVFSYLASDEESRKAYKKCAEKLSSSTYFTDLKARWNALTPRPKLSVITGTAGHLFSVIPGTAFEGCYTPDTVTFEPFDGLVTLGEQNAITHAEFLPLANYSVPCYADRKYAQSVCSSQHGIVKTCKQACTLQSISISGTLQDVILKAVSDVLAGNPVSVSTDFLTAAYAGVARDKSSCPEGYEEFYDIFANPFSHHHIRYNPITIGHLLVLLTT